MQAGAQQADNTLTINFDDLIGELSSYVQRKQDDIFRGHLAKAILSHEDLYQIFGPLRDATPESYVQALNNMNNFMSDLYTQQDMIQAQLHENKLSTSRLAQEIRTEEAAKAKAEAEYARLKFDSQIKRQQLANINKAAGNILALRKKEQKLDTKFRELQTQVIDTKCLSEYEIKIRKKFIHSLSGQITDKEAKKILRDYFNKYLIQDNNYVSERDLESLPTREDDAIAASLYKAVKTAFKRAKNAQSTVHAAETPIPTKAIFQYIHILESYKYAVDRYNAYLHVDAKAGHSATELGFDFAGAPEVLRKLDIFELQTKDVRDDHHEYVCLDTHALGKMDPATVKRFEALFQVPAIVRSKGSNGFKITKPDQFNKSNKGEETVPVCKLVATGMASYRIFPTHKLEKGDGTILWVFGEARATKGGASKGDYDNAVRVIKAPELSVKS